MKAIERKGAVIVAIMFAAALLTIMLVARNGVGASAEPTVCRIVADDNEAYRHAYAEGKFLSLPEWERRHKAFRGDISGGVTVPMSIGGSGRLWTRDVTIHNEVEYRAALRAQNIPLFLSLAAETMVLPNGNEIALDDGGGSVFPIRGGANNRYWFYNDLEPTDDNIWCYEVRGRGHPTPTPTPEPPPADDDAESEAEDG